MLSAEDDYSTEQIAILNEYTTGIGERRDMPAEEGQWCYSALKFSVYDSAYAWLFQSKCFQQQATEADRVCKPERVCEESKLQYDVCLRHHFYARC